MRMSPTFQSGGMMGTTSDCITNKTSANSTLGLARGRQMHVTIVVIEWLAAFLLAVEAIKAHNLTKLIRIFQALVKVFRYPFDFSWSGVLYQMENRTIESPKDVQRMLRRASQRDWFFGYSSVLVGVAIVWTILVYFGVPVLSNFLAVVNWLWSLSVPLNWVATFMAVIVSMVVFEVIGMFIPLGLTRLLLCVIGIMKKIMDNTDNGISGISGFELFSIASILKITFPPH
jgi:hypothetical protein